MKSRYDLVVIGTGTAASVIAHSCRDQGWTVAVIDHQPFGGTCAVRGCDPKKVLVAAAEAMDAAERMREKGVVLGKLNIDWGALQRFKRTFTDPVSGHSEKSFRDKGIDAYHGKARFVSPDCVQIGDQALNARHFAIAAGAKPVKLPIPGAEYLTDSTRFLELEKLPDRIVFAGGGFIGFEFAHVVARAGATATILNRGSRPLNQFDPDLVDLLIERTRSLGVEVLTKHTLLGIERRGDAYAVRADTPTGEREFVADLVVHSAGRVPAVADLNLESAEVSHDSTAISLNEYLQSVSNPAVYAAGDAANTGFPLTPVAAMEGRAVAANLLQGNHKTVDYTGIPSAVFTVPALARVGLLEKDARKLGLKYRVKFASVPGWYTARRLNEPSYAHKVLVEEKTDRLLGAHLLGPDAAEVANIFALAIRSGLGAMGLANAKFVYPTAASDIGYMLP